MAVPGIRADPNTLDFVAHQYVFQMHRLSRSYPPDKEVLKNVTLAFLPGAKIGVLGYNGAGKSTVLRIMAGGDTQGRGGAPPPPRATPRPLRQGPPPAPAKDERGNRPEGGGRTRAPPHPLHTPAA